MWSHIYNEVLDVMGELNSDLLFFRGHGNPSWQLTPNINRFKYKTPTGLEKLEGVTFFDYKTRSGSLLERNCSSWDIAFSMQHHGLPTRLLDWSESFAIALYFALKGVRGKQSCCVWIMNPFHLNKKYGWGEVLPHPSELDSSYEDYFILNEGKIKCEYDVLAISPLRHNSRMFNQHAGFTIHFNLDEKLDENNDFIHKVVIPHEAHDEARLFLKLAGITEFSIFQDLDGLSRDIYGNHYAHLLKNKKVD